MIGVTLFGLMLTPVFFFVLMWFGSGGRAGMVPVPQAVAPAPPPDPYIHRSEDRPSARGGPPTGSDGQGGS